MENQQQQPVMPPTNEFLMRMDSANMPAPEPEKKGPSKGLIIGIIVGVIAVIGIIVAVIMMNSKKPETKPTTYTSTVPEIDEEMEARNEKRKNDLVPLGEAVKKYQAADGADGQLPGYKNENWDTVIAQFVPGGQIVDGADGEVYKMGKVCKFSEANCMDISSLSWEENKHEIYVMYNADCKGTTKNNVIVSSTRKRHAAIFAIVEGDQFICATND